jgi:monoamine oxidase
MSPTNLEPSALPSKDPLRSFWLSEPSELADHRTTGQLPKEADVIIVGSGIAGSLTAYNLLDVNPKLNMVMLEAREVCGGATGRNGGQIKTDPYIACKFNPDRPYLAITDM